MSKFLKLLLIFCVSSFLIGAINAPAFSIDPDTLKSINTVFVIIATALVFFMQIGFIMLEAGFTQVKNSSNVAMKGFIDFGVGVLVFFFFGFGLMFGVDALGLIGTTGFILHGSIPSTPSSLPDSVYFLFQAAFAGATATIVSGAVHGRIKFSAYVISTIIIIGIIYSVGGHWVWNANGWLAKMGMLDFAGSAVVHTIGGFVALAGIVVLGSRIGKYNKDGTPNVIAGHNIPLAALGTFILWFGWFGFNGGSALTAEDPHLIGEVLLNSNLAAAAGGIAAMIFTATKFGKPDVTMALNGILAGLVAITGGCAFVGNLSAIIIGALAGIICTLSVLWLDKKGIDDPIGAVSVHGVCGAFGILALGLLHSKQGLLTTGNFTFFAVQLIGEVVIIMWAFGMGFALYKLLDKFHGLRQSAEDEEAGSDMAEHGLEAYPEHIGRN